ncbi:MAG: hypothetical protein LBS84_09290 [Clostridiales bacterium]|jgi:hypothetical protein|nr:hypothetical protein [Clostridiales bacterium]
MKKRTLSGMKERLIKISALIVAVLGIITCVSCGARKTESETEKPFPESTESEQPTAEAKKKGEIIGAYSYPENPAEALRTALDKDVEKRGLPLTIGEVERISFDKWERSQIVIGFTENSDNLCVIDFSLKHLEYSYERSLFGHDNPSFTIAFKDPDNVQDMEIVLTSIIKYLSPDLSLEEARHLAINQDKTLGTDGYSQPADIGGYQVQARYATPNVFFRTPDFDAKLGVTVRAIAQLWGSGLDKGLCHELTTGDFDLLTSEHPWRWDEESDEPSIVYSDFIVKDVSEHQSYIHGETWHVVMVESILTGEEYRLTLDTWAFSDTYEFGIGQEYTLFISRKYVSGVSGGIMYAVQKTESAQFNSCGFQSLDYFTHDYDSRWWRVEPEEDGTIYNVYFVLQSQTWGEAFAVLEGHGLGEAQWRDDPPGWDGYTFVGWYDNTEWNGEPYTKDTPIYKETYLHARWKYTGSGGAWPRAHRGAIEGIQDGGTLAAGSEVAITALGYNTTLESPGDQRFRWTPVSWRLSDGKKGMFSDTVPFTATLTAEPASEQTLYITYVEEIYDMVGWQKTGQVHETAEINFTVK